MGATDAYLAAYLTAAGVATDVRGLDPAAYRRPVPNDVLWRRPYTQMRLRLEQGAAFPEASRFGSQMAGLIAATDLEYAHRGASRDWMKSEPDLTGYRRVLDPASDSCGLCVASSDQLYHVEDLLPIHDRCRCTVAPVSTSRRFGLSEGRYQQVLDQTGGDTSREALSSIRLGAPQDGAVPFRVYDHGELGPYLYDANRAPPALREAA